ncbi:hypothetical protein [Dactylosporangium darangshiense]
MHLRMLIAVAVLVLAGCSGTGNQPSPSPDPGGASDAAPLLAAARCMRANGYPDYPDPVQQDGRWVFPLRADAPTPPAACESLFDQGKQGGERRNAVTPADMVKLRQWADCIRTHGVPDWPDPDSEGTFQAPAAINPSGDDPVFGPAYRACERYVPAGGIDIGNAVKPQRS